MKIRKYKENKNGSVNHGGFFIVIDGGDGAGTTSVSKELVKKLGWSALYTHEPGGSPYAEKIRDLLLSDDAKMSDAKTQFALFWAARRDHLAQTVRPAIEKGKIVICDRFDSSTYAYQIVAQGNNDLEDLFWNIRKSFLENIEPDLYILLDVPAKVGMARAREREEELNHFDRMKLDFHEAVNEGLRDFVGEKIVQGHIIDATQDFDSVVSEALQIIEQFINLE
jgi:dTMP kinase